MAPASKRRRLSNGGYEVVGTDQAGPPSKKASNGPSHDHTRSLFVRSLPATITSERLAEHFSQSFAIKHATVVLDPKTKLSKGFGFVTFVDTEDAQAAIEKFNDSIIDSRKIKVEQAQARNREDGQDGVPAQNSKAAEIKAKKEKEKQDAQPPRLIVRNLPWSIKTSEDLAALFKSYGKVKQAIVPKRAPNVQSGFGIVMIRGQQNTEKALAGVNGKEVDGRALAVDWAVDKQTWTELQKEKAVKESSDIEEEKSVPTDKSDHVIGNPDEPMESEEEKSSSSLRIEDESEQGDLAQDTDDTSIASSEDKREEDKNNTTVFIRNLPFTVEDEDLKDHFKNFGAVRYARVVFDPETERSRGTGFVCFFNEADAKDCVINAPKQDQNSSVDIKNNRHATTHSILQDQASDPSGQYTLDGRVLQVSRALSKNDANQKANESKAKRDAKERDKRRLYLLSEGTISKGSKLYEQLGKAEIDIRESSAKQRQKLIKENPNLGLSLTRLSIRNMPRGVGGKELKALAREAVVGFAADVKAGFRQPLSREELSRGGEEMREAEKKRKEKGVGIVKQAKIVFESKEGGKVREGGGGRSRGYGFIEYVTHRNALAGLRWLNGHLVRPSVADGEKAERGKRLIAEFAIENAQVVQRRSDRERKVYERGPRQARPATEGGRAFTEKRGVKRKAVTAEDGSVEKAIGGKNKKSVGATEVIDQSEKDRLAKRNRIIAKKRKARKDRKA